MKTSLLKPILVKYSALSAVTVALTSPAMAIERPTPAEQPVEKKEAPLANNAVKPVPMPNIEGADKMLTYLGVYGDPITPNLAHHLKINKGVGVALELIAPRSPASKAGLKKRDIILKIAGQDISSMADIRKVVTNKNAGEQVAIQIISEGKKITKNVTLSERPTPKAIGRVQPEREQELGRFPNEDMLNMGLPQELLEQFPEKDRERLNKLFAGGAFEDKFKNLEKQFGELNELIPDFPANPRMNFQGNFQSSVKMIDQHGSITLQSTNEGKVIELKDRQGKIQYRGPYNNEIDKASVPEELRGRVDNLDIDNKVDFFKQPKLNARPKLRLKLPNKNGPEGRMRFEFNQLPQQKNNGNKPNADKVEDRLKSKFTFKNSIKFSKTDRTTGNQYTYAKRNGKIQVEVHDRAGKLLYNGPYNTDLDKASVPEEFQGFIEQLSKSKR